MWFAIITHVEANTRIIQIEKIKLSYQVSKFRLVFTKICRLESFLSKLKYDLFIFIISYKFKRLFFILVYLLFKLFLVFELILFKIIFMSINTNII